MILTKNTASSEVSGSFLVFPGSSPITTPCLLQKRARCESPSLQRCCPASPVLWLSPTPDRAATLGDAEAAAFASVGPPTLPEIPFPRAVPNTPVGQSGASVGFFPDRAAFPFMGAGRRSPHHFRGLLRVHFRYGPQDCSTSHGGLGHEASMESVTQLHHSSSTRLDEVYLGGTFIRWHLAPSWRTA